MCCLTWHFFNDDQFHFEEWFGTNSLISQFVVCVYCQYYSTNTVMATAFCLAWDALNVYIELYIFCWKCSLFSASLEIFCRIIVLLSILKYCFLFFIDFIFWLVTIGYYGLSVIPQLGHPAVNTALYMAMFNDPVTLDLIAIWLRFYFRKEMHLYPCQISAYPIMVIAMLLTKCQPI